MRELGFYSQLNCAVSEQMKDWYFTEANNRSTMFKRVPVADILREALQFYIDHHTKKPKA